MKKMIAAFLVLIVLCGLSLFPAAGADPASTVDPCGLRGWDLDSGYQYVIMGWYPYEKDPAINKKNANDPEMYDPAGARG